MEQFLRKSQNSGEITWTRVKRSNGNYGYVRTKNGRPVDFDEYTGKFKMYDLPDTNSNWTEASKAGTSYGKIKSIEIRPGSHEDYVAQQKLVDEHVKRVAPTAEDLFTIGTLGGLKNFSPTLWGRRVWDLGLVVQGNMSWNKFGNNWFYGNNGLVSDKYAKEHPYASAALNLVGDVGAFGTLSALRKLPKYATLMEAENRAAQETSALNWRDMFTNSTRRTRLGDVEIDNPNLLYHLDRGDRAGAFSTQGAYVEDGFLFPGTPKDASDTPYSWWNKGKPYATNVGEQPMTRLMTTTEGTPGMLHVRSQNYPIGQWNGKKGFVLNSEFVSPEPVDVYNNTFKLEPGYGYRRVVAEEPSTSLKFFERKPSRISEAERLGVPKGERNVKQGYLLKDAIEEANKFAEKWGYDKLPQNATLLDIENLYNQHNTFFRGVTTEHLENTRNIVAKELGINPELLTNELYLLYVSTHPWPGNDRIWVTPFSHYGKIYGNTNMIGGKGQLSAVMRPWKITKDIKQWPKLSLWTLGFKEDVSNSVITPWVSKAPDAIRSLGALSEFLVKPPLIYRGLGKDFKGTFLLYLKYKDNQGKLGWIESLVGELPLEIIIEKQGGKMNTLLFLKNGSGIHIEPKNRGKFTSGGKNGNKPRIVTTGGAGYVPSVDYALANKVSNLWKYAKSYVNNKILGTGDGTFIDLSNQHVSRIGSKSKGVKTILANEFVEKNKNTVRKKKDFVNTTDTLLGDKKIPLSKISTFYGVENGKLKAGNISTFNNNTVIVPNRAKTVGRIKKYYPGKPATEKFNKAVDEELRKYNNLHNYSPSIGGYINSLLTLSKPSPLGTLRANVGNDKAIDILNSFQEKYKNLGESELPYVITENNDTIRGYELNATPKVMFADEKGNSVFVSNLHNNNNVKKLNQFLSKHPSYPVMVDNGRYSSYMTNTPNAEIYGGLNRPDDMFIIGTTKKALGGNLFKDGGPKGNKPRIVTTGGAGYIPPIDTENIKKDLNLKNRLYRTISPVAADYNIPYVASKFLKGKDYDYTIDTSPNDDIIRRAPTIDAIWANYLQIPKKDRRYNAVLGKSKYKPSKGNNNSTYYKLPLVDFEKAELIDRTRDLSLNSNKIDSIFSGYALGDHTIGRGYDNKGEYVSYFDTFDINPFNGKYMGLNIPLLNKLDDIGLGHPLKIYDRIYLDDYYGVPSSGRGGVYLPEVTVYGKTKKKALGGKMNTVKFR